METEFNPSKVYIWLPIVVAIVLPWPLGYGIVYFLSMPPIDWGCVWKICSIMSIVMGCAIFLIQTPLIFRKKLFDKK